MVIDELVQRYARDEVRPSGAVVVCDAAQALLPALAGLDAVAWSEDVLDGSTVATLVDLAGAPELATLVGRTAGRLRDHDVAVLLLDAPVDALPVGALVADVTAAGLRVLEVRSLQDRLARTILVVSRDPERAHQTHLLASGLHDDDRLRLREHNEWAVEGVQLRARVEVLERRAGALTAQVHALTEQAAALREDNDRLRPLADQLPPLKQEQARTASELARAVALAESRRPSALASRTVGAARRRLGRVRRAMAGLLTGDRGRGTG